MLFLAPERAEGHACCCLLSLAFVVFFCRQSVMKGLLLLACGVFCCQSVMKGLFLIAFGVDFWRQSVLKGLLLLAFGLDLS